jgi:protein gp37
MSDNTQIEWTDATWNPITGCSRVSEGCRNCYAEIMAARFSKPGQWGEGLAKIVTRADGTKDHRWTGKLQFNERALDKPLRWRKPRLIFVNSTSDLFHESVPDEWIDRVFAVMALAPQHTFQVLTKRPERARAYLMGVECDGARRFNVATAAEQIANNFPIWDGHGYRLWDGYAGKDWDKKVTRVLCIPPWPLPNVWLGTSIEDQATADARIPHLLATPAAVRFVSAEPLLGPVDLMEVAIPRPELRASLIWDALRGWGGAPSKIDWLIVGGESGPGARPMHPDWARSLRDQCQTAGAAYFFKQVGEWTAWEEFGSLPLFRNPYTLAEEDRHILFPSDWDNAPNWDDGLGFVDTDRHVAFHRVGKSRAGRLLDGRTWDELPEARHD